MSEKKIEAVNGHTLQKVFLSVEDHIAVMTLHNPPVNAADGVVQEEILLLCDYINSHSHISPTVSSIPACTNIVLPSV